MKGTIFAAIPIILGLIAFPFMLRFWKPSPESARRASLIASVVSGIALVVLVVILARQHTP